MAIYDFPTMKIPSSLFLNYKAEWGRYLVYYLSNSPHLDETGFKITLDMQNRVILGKKDEANYISRWFNALEVMIYEPFTANKSYDGVVEISAGDKYEDGWLADDAFKWQIACHTGFEDLYDGELPDGVSGKVLGEAIAKPEEIFQIYDYIKKIIDYLEHWRKFFEEWKKGESHQKKLLENDKIWNDDKRKGKVWKTKKGIEKSTELEYNVLPQPYLGNIENHSVITLNLNPSRSKKNDENIEFEKNYLPKFKESENYYKYAESFPTYDSHSFWQDQKNWIDRIFKILDKDAPVPSEKKIKPFAIEICPWGSKSFQTLEIKKDDPLIKYMDHYVFDVIEKVIEHSKLKVVLSVGKAYYDIFDNKKTDFVREKEISYQNKPEGIDWPQTKDKVSGKDRDVKRTFSIWKKGKILYINTYASGSNNPPSEDFNEIQNGLINKYVNKQ